MDATSYKQIRQRIGSWVIVAGLLGVHWRTIARRESGEIPISEEAERALSSLPPSWQETVPPLPTPRGTHILHVPGYPGYAATTDGRVFGCRSKCPNRKYPYNTTWTELKATKGSRGYWLITLAEHGTARRRQFKLHQVILLTFSGPAPAGHQGRHLNDDPDNNQLFNLAWGTSSQNRQDMIRNGGVPDRKGSKHPMAKLTDGDVRRIRKLRATTDRTLKSIAAPYGITEAMVCKIARRKSWTHLA